MTSKSDQDNLQAVLNAAREEDQQLMTLDARLQAAGIDRWLAGELSAEEQQQLQEKAQHDPELADALKLFAPLSSADEALANAVIAAMPVAAKQPNDLSRARAKRRPVQLLRWTPLLAAAAAVAVFMMVKANPQDPQPSLPAYVASLRGGETITRGEEPPSSPSASPWQLPADGPFEIVLRPQTAATQPVAVTSFVRFPPQAALQPWPVPFEVGQSGAARLTGNADGLLAGRKGLGQLVFVIHPAASKKPAADLVSRGQLPEGGRMVIVPVQLLTNDSVP